MKLVSREIHISNAGISHQVFEVGEGTFHCGANPVFLPIPFFLPGGEMRTATASLVEDTVIHPGFPALPFQGVVGIPLVAENRALVTRYEVCAFRGIVNGRGGEPDTPDNARTLVDTDVSLVPEISFLPAFGRRSVRILLRALRSIIARCTLLPGRLHQRGVHYGSSPENESLLVDLHEEPR